MSIFTRFDRGFLLGVIVGASVMAAMLLFVKPAKAQDHEMRSWATSATIATSFDSCWLVSIPMSGPMVIDYACAAKNKDQTGAVGAWARILIAIRDGKAVAK